METLALVLESFPDRPRDINPRIAPALEAICLKCLEKDPRDRYPSAEAVAEDLEAYVHGDPVLAEARSTSRLMRLLLRESRHSEVMARWGRVWIWHAGLFLAFFLVTNLLLVANVQALGPYVALWSVGLAGMIDVVWYHRIRGGTRLMPIERQVGQVWVLFVIGCGLTGLINHLTSRDISELLPLVVLQCGLACGCTATILGGTFHVLAIVCAAMAVVMAITPGVGALAFGFAFPAGLIVTGLRYTRREGATPPGPRSAESDKTDPGADRPK